MVVEQDGSLALGVTRDLDMALELVVRAAKEHGNPEAQHLLAVAYATGTTILLLLLLRRWLAGGAGSGAVAEVYVSGRGGAGILGKVDVPKPGEEEAEGPSDEVKAIMHDYFGAMGGNVRSAMALGYRWVGRHSLDS